MASPDKVAIIKSTDMADEMIEDAVDYAT